MAESFTINLASHLAEKARLNPDQPAVVYPARDGRGGARCTFRELEQASNQLARGLERIGLRPGMRVALMIPPGLDFFALTFALFKLGAIPVLIDPGMGLQKVGKSLAEAGPEAFIGSPKAHLARLLFTWSPGTISVKVTVGGQSFFGGRPLARVRRLGAGEEVYAPKQPAPDEMAAILFTSGSTGPSKGVVYTHEIFNRQIEYIRELYQIQPGEIDLPTFPLFGLFGPALGMTVILPDMDPTKPAQVDPVRIITAMREFKVTSMFGSPAVINRVGRYGAEQNLKLTGMRRVISAGAPVPAKVLERFAAMLPPGTQVFTPYGATECLPVSSIGSDEILRETRHQTDQGRGVCVGLPVPGLVVKVIRITDDPIPVWNDDLVLPAGEIGEIVVQGPHVTGAYYNRPEATALSKILDSIRRFYHRMGDVGYFDDRGRIWFCGRKSHRVVTPQATLFTIPCEAIFNLHPAVFRSALVGVTNGLVTEPVLCVELEQQARGADRKELREELLTLGRKHPHTKPIKTILFHPGFPVDVRHNSKIFREKLAFWASRQLR
jgi:acyl-CoA synthetase (AMP-forming)/AMP-acid ligase II